MEKYSAVGLPHTDIARILGFSRETLEKYYREELNLGMAKANAAVGGALYKSALEGNVAAQIFWAKSRMGWRETVENIIQKEIVFRGGLDPVLNESFSDSFDPESTKVVDAGR